MVRVTEHKHKQFVTEIQTSGYHLLFTLHYNNFQTTDFMIEYGFLL